MSEIDFRADASLDLETPKRLELKDPVTDEPIVDEAGNPAFITIYSAQSEVFQRRAFKIQGRWKQLTKKVGKSGLSFDQERQAEAEIYAAAIGDEWNIVRKVDGKWKRIEAPCTPQNAVNWILANPLYKPQIAAQTDDLDEYVGDAEGNFTKEASSRSSKASKTA